MAHRSRSVMQRVAAPGDWQTRCAQERILEICDGRRRHLSEFRRVWEGSWRPRGADRRIVRPVAIQSAWMMEAIGDDGRWLEADWQGAICFTLWEREDGTLWPSASDAVG